MKYSGDSLLNSNELVLYNNTLNIYSALIKKEDFENKRPLNSIVYVTGKFIVQIKKQISEELIKKLEIYMQQKITKESINHWLKNDIFPLTLLRVLSLESKSPYKQLSQYISQIDKILNYNRSTELRLPHYFDELLSNGMIYFYGYLLGDGCISKNILIKLCDGHPNKELVIYSEQYLTTIQKYLKNTFNVYSKLTRIDNKYELVLVSKSLCRYFKFFYGFEKDKGKITKPDIIKYNHDKSCIFYRGLFDADAGLKVKDKYLVFKSTDEKFLKQCILDFNNYGIQTSNIFYDNFQTPYFKIYSHNLFDFAKHIGFNHPRKQKDLVVHLKNGCFIKKLCGVNENNLIKGYYDLSKIKDLRIIGISKVFNMYRRRIGTQYEVASLLHTYRENIKRWENGDGSIPFIYYYKLMKLNRLDLITILEDFSKRKILFGRGRLKQFVKLPIIYTNSHFELFQYLTPMVNKTIIKSYGINDRNFNRRKLLYKIRCLFNIKISKDPHSEVIFSNLISTYLSTFYNYKNSWDPLSDSEIEMLKHEWKRIYK